MLNMTLQALKIEIMRLIIGQPFCISLFCIGLLSCSSSNKDKNEISTCGFEIEFNTLQNQVVLKGTRNQDMLLQEFVDSMYNRVPYFSTQPDYAFSIISNSKSFKCMLNTFPQMGREYDLILNSIGSIDTVISDSKSYIDKYQKVRILVFSHLNIGILDLLSRFSSFDENSLVIVFYDVSVTDGFDPVIPQTGG